MKHQSITKCTMIGIPIIVAVGSLLHFIYDWSGQALLVGLFALGSCRLGFYPLLFHLYCLVLLHSYGRIQLARSVVRYFILCSWRGHRAVSWSTCLQSCANRQAGEWDFHTINSTLTCNLRLVYPGPSSYPSFHGSVKRYVWNRRLETPLVQLKFALPLPQYSSPEYQLRLT